MGHDTSLFISLSRNNNWVAGGLTPQPHNTPEKPGSSTIIRGHAESEVHRIYPAIRRASFSKNLKMIVFEILPYFLYTNRHIRGEKANIEAALVKTRKRAA